MAITINGTANTVAGLAVGGLPDGSTDADALASNAVTNVKVADDAIGVAELSATGTASNTTFLRGDNAWAAPGGGDLKLDTVQTKDCFSGEANHDDQHLVFNVGADCVEWWLSLKMLSCGANDQIQLTLGHSSITYSDSYLGGSAMLYGTGGTGYAGHDLDSTVAQLNKDWHSNGNKFVGIIRGVRSHSTGAYHVWQIESQLVAKDGNGMNWTSFSCQLSHADNPLTAVRLSSEGGTGFDNGTVRYGGILKV